jgi:glutamine cyclotransferase
MVWQRMLQVALVASLMAATAMCGCPPWNNGSPIPSGARQYTYQVVQTLPHDPEAFTQGFLYDEGSFYEGTGLNGASSLRRLDLETGTVHLEHELDAEYFGEGITLLGERVYQLTWQSGKGFIYSKGDFTALGTFTYSGEGWGLTSDGERLIMSDGTSRLRFLDPETLQETGQISVRDETGPVSRLNELEYVEGEVFANIWMRDYIVRIDPDTGQVTGTIDCSGLLTQAERRSADVLNGIAYDPETGRLWVTGKLWPKVFEIQLVPVEDDAA